MHVMEMMVNYILILKANKGGFAIYPKIGATFSSAEVKNSVGNVLEDRQSVSFDNATGFSFGVQLEYILPFNNKKWSLFIEPNYQSYSSEASIEKQISPVRVFEQDALIDYSFLEIPVGVRHSFFLNDTSKIFVNAAFNIVMDLDGEIVYSVSDNLEVKSRSNFTFGLGYAYDRFNIEFRVYSKRNITSDATQIRGEYTNASIVLGYRILNF